MVILGNPILGKIFAGSSLRLNKDGLFRRVVVDNKSHNIFITSDLGVICKLLGMSFEDLDSSDEEDMYDYITSSPKFSKTDFMGGREMRGSTSLSRFASYLEDIAPVVHVEKIRTVEIMSLVDIDLRREIDETRMVLAAKPTKFNGGILLKRYPQLEPRFFQAQFNRFNESFGGYYPHHKFMVQNNEETITNYFLEINNIKINEYEIPRACK